MGNRMERRLLAFVAVALLISPAYAEGDAARGPIAVIAAWSRATGPGMSVGAGYMVISNLGISADRLISVSSPVAERVEIHRTSTDDGTVRMRQVTEGVPVPAGGTVEFAPGALHLMLVQLKQPLHAGQSVPITLVFERAGAVAASLSVMPMGAPPARK